MQTDTLTIQISCDESRTWEALIGPDFVGGIAGYGPTPLIALRDLCENISKFEGARTDSGAISLR